MPSEIRTTELEDTYDVGMIDLSSDPHFALEPLDELGLRNELRFDDLQGDGILELLIGNSINVRHSAGADLALNAIALIEQVARLEYPHDW